jgi:hypothetical protein
MGDLSPMFLAEINESQAATGRDRTKALTGQRTPKRVDYEYILA